jgi:hypothetical protein
VERLGDQTAGVGAISDLRGELRRQIVRASAQGQTERLDFPLLRHGGYVNRNAEP